MSKAPSTDIAVAAAQPLPVIQHDTPSAFGSIAAFENVQRMAKLLCGSTIVPQSYRDNLADTVIALEMANRMNANPLAVMQNLYLVLGKPGWSSTFLISCVNCCGKFTPLRYRMTGTKNTDSWGCIAWAKDSTGEVLESPEVTIGISKSEGWYNRNGSKWKTMPELMLRYRAATWFTRTYAPELTMGMRTEDEIVDIEANVNEPRMALAAGTSDGPDLGDDAAAAEAGLAPEKKAEPAKATTPESKKTPARKSPAPSQKADAPMVNYPRALRGLLASAGIEEGNFMLWLNNSQGIEAETLEMACAEHEAKVKEIHDEWGDRSVDIQEWLATTAG